jgi:hypothetical protein
MSRSAVIEELPTNHSLTVVRSREEFVGTYYPQYRKGAY